MVDAKPRRYHGTDLRSTLEAHWAATLDDLGIDWEYEPSGIQLPSGAAYVPDFWLPEIGTWIEVKGYGVDRIEKPRELARTLLCTCRGRCRCEWYGGQIVIVGRDSGLWEDGLLINTYLVQCASCSAWSWRRLRHSLRCRKCRAPAGPYSHLLASGEMPFRHADTAIPWPELPAGVPGWTAAS